MRRGVACDPWRAVSWSLAEVVEVRVQPSLSPPLAALVMRRWAEMKMVMRMMKMRRRRGTWGEPQEWIRDQGEEERAWRSLGFWVIWVDLPWEVAVVGDVEGSPSSSAKWME